MSLEHSPERQQRTPSSPSNTPAPADNLLIGAESIALYIYGKADHKEVRDIYRNPFGFSFFKHGNAIAALKTTICAELLEAQRTAQEERRQKKTAEARVLVRPRRRRARNASAADSNPEKDLIEKKAGRS